VDPRYTSPEAIGEVSGIYLVPRTDIYSLGCILAFAVSGEHPTGRPEAPWSDAAFARFAPLPDGFRLLVAHLTQTLHKHRSASVDKVLTWMSEESLPTMATPGFGALSLLRPLDAEKEPEPVPAPAHLSVLSPGPLVVRPREAEPAPVPRAPAVNEAKPAEAPAEAAEPAAERRWWSLLGWLLLALALASLVARALRS
jgi:serine/threonine protein kinase